MIYVHIPFCHRKCTYCAFYSRPAAAEARMEAYVERLVAEMEARRAEQVHPIRTVYFGGGTPSILPMDLLSRIVHALRRWYDLSHLEEATVECNPEDVTPQYAAALAALGFFNRVSLGVQSTDDEALHLIGRRHSAAQAAEAVARLGEAGFDNISVDFIYGLPTDFRLPDIDLAPVGGAVAVFERIW